MMINSVASNSNYTMGFAAKPPKAQTLKDVAKKVAKKLTQKEERMIKDEVERMKALYNCSESDAYWLVTGKKLI